MQRLLIAVCLLVCSETAFACDFSQVKFQHNFPTGRVADCQQLADDKFLLTLRPENQPINDSAWYAFKVQAKQAATIEVALKVEGGKHRYPPKISADGKQWRLQPYQIKDDRLVMKLGVDQQATWIAAQEILSNQDYVKWGQALAQADNVSQQQFGWSVQDRPIYKIEARGQGHEWLVVLGRQHPPEVTGALAMLTFTETLLSNTELAKAFRQRFNILVVPNLNPDGVYLGNWRHNANGVDLNRDWNSFLQPEVKAVDQYLKKLQAQQQNLAMAVDFHSTYKDIFYTMPSDYGVKNPMLVSQWLTALDAEYPDFKVIDKPGNNPSMGVFKQYFADAFNVHAITYEMGDRTDRIFIEQLATSAANQLMKAMLASQ